MFILDANKVRNKVFFYQEHSEDNKLIPYLLVRDEQGWHRHHVDDLDVDDYGYKIISMHSKKSDKTYWWFLKDIIYTQYNGQVPEGYIVRQLENNNYMPSNFVLVKFNQTQSSD